MFKRKIFSMYDRSPAGSPLPGGLPSVLGTIVGGVTY